VAKAKPIRKDIVQHHTHHSVNPYAMATYHQPPRTNRPKMHTHTVTDHLILRIQSWISNPDHGSYIHHAHVQITVTVTTEFNAHSQNHI